MQPKAILLPICGQILLTLAVWTWMYITRLTAIRRSRADVQELADEARSEEILKDVVNPSDNLENLFELPILFYVAMLVLFVSGLTDPLYVYAAWAFVALRAVHSFVHCAYNRVMHRFTAYILASFVLWAIWIRITVQLVSN